MVNKVLLLCQQLMLKSFLKINWWNFYSKLLQGLKWQECMEGIDGFVLMLVCDDL
jgi:hypothetical protein